MLVDNCEGFFAVGGSVYFAEQFLEFFFQKIVQFCFIFYYQDGIGMGIETFIRLGQSNLYSRSHQVLRQFEGSLCRGLRGCYGQFVIESSARFRIVEGTDVSVMQFN